MESEQHPPSSSSLLSHQHDFSSLVSWPDHWQPESFEITTTNTSNIPSEMTQVVPEHVARAKLGGGNNNNNNNSRKENNSTQRTRPQRSNSATLSTISVTCETDTSVKTHHSRPQPSPSKQSSIMFNTTNNIGASHSTSALTTVSIVPRSSFHNHQQRTTSISTSSEMNIVHEKANLIASASTMSIPNKHLIKTTTGATGGPLASTKSLSIKHKSTSFDDHRSTRGIGKSVLEHLVFVFPENVRRILAGPKK